MPVIESGFEDDMNNSEENLNVSKLVTEDDLIDSLFYKCDEEKTGEVAVSKLIEYLKLTTAANTQVWKMNNEIKRVWFD